MTDPNNIVTFPSTPSKHDKRSRNGDTGNRNPPGGGGGDIEKRKQNVIYCLLTGGHHSIMDMNQLRIEALKQLIGSQKIKDFADQYDLDASYLSQMLNGHRPMGEKAARNLETKVGLPTGYLTAPSMANPINECSAADSRLIDKLETAMRDVQVRLIRIETRAESIESHMTTKSDLQELIANIHKTLNDQTWKFIGVASALAAIAFTAARFIK